jgi:hypothetical protein
MGGLANGFVKVGKQAGVITEKRNAPVAAAQVSKAAARTESITRRKTTQSRAASSASNTLSSIGSDSSLVFKKLLGQ